MEMVMDSGAGDGGTSDFSEGLEVVVADGY